MGNYFYLLLDLLSISFPLLATFDKRIGYYKNLKYIFPGIFITGVFFIFWDAFYTKWGIWGFNQKYLLGVDFINLPLEEWLFFFCIPYASIFIYESVKYFKKGHVQSFKSKWISLVLGIVLITLALIFNYQAYTFATFLLLGIYLLLLEFLLKVKWLSHFYMSYLWVLIPFFIVNGFLTGSFIEEQVVWYDNTENFGIRIGTIPVEDVFYGMLLIVMSVHIFEFLKTKNSA